MRGFPAGLPQVHIQGQEQDAHGRACRDTPPSIKIPTLVAPVTPTWTDAGAAQAPLGIAGSTVPDTLIRARSHAARMERPLEASWGTLRPQGTSAREGMLG